MKFRKIDSFFKKRTCEDDERDEEITTPTTEPVVNDPRIEIEEIITIASEPVNVPRTDESTDMVDLLHSLERDPGKRPPIWRYPPNQQDEIRRAYLNWGPYQIRLKDYPFSGQESHRRRFQHSWFSLFPSWLEYSPSKDAAYCLPCYLFNKGLSGHPLADVFVTGGFNAWKRVREGKRCAFLRHIGKDPCSSHNNAMKACEDLLNQEADIRNLIEVHNSNEIIKNRLRINTSIDAIRWLTLQACAFRGHDETSTSNNRGNFIELLKLLASYNVEVAKVVLENAPQHAIYSSPKIQKELLSVLASGVRKHIREEIGDSKFCIIVDEARDESKKEQMSLVLRFVDRAGLIQERFFDIQHVADTASLTLKEKICDVLSMHNLDVSNIRGQGYDGASNMRGQWNGLQSLFMKDCPFAYYVHCFAHRLQLALVSASRDLKPIHRFFDKLTMIVNVVTSSTKRHDELQAAQVTEVKYMEEIEEIMTGKGKNQIGTLCRAGDTRWGSHFRSICSVINMYEATCHVLKKLRKESKSWTTSGDADTSYNYLKEFDFILILFMMKEIMGKTDILCQALQKQDQDVVNAIDLVRSTKRVIQDLRDDGWDELLSNVTSFCQRHKIEIPDLNDVHSTTRYGRSRLEENQVTVEHYFRVEIFFTAIDKQLQELNSRFSEQSMELLTLSCALTPKNTYKAFKVETICTLVEKYYPLDFTESEQLLLPYQLENFIANARQSSHLKNLSTIQELCSHLVETEKATIYFLIDRLLRLILTLPVSTATTERSFSAMKIIKNKVRNKMSSEFLADSMSVYIEREIAANISSDTIIDDFKARKPRNVKF